MPLILAIEPDPRQAAQIAAIVRHRIGAELMLAGTTEQALDVIGDRVPDLVLVPALLSPQDDAALAAALRVIAAAAHVRTLTIPVLGNSNRRPRNEGMLAKWRRGRGDSSQAPDGCDPAIFAEQISAYLREAAAERAALEPEPLADEAPVAAAEQSSAPVFETEDAIVAAFAPAEDEAPAFAAAAAEPLPVVSEQPIAAEPPVQVDDDPAFSDFPVFPTLPAFANPLADELAARAEGEPASFSMPKASWIDLDLSDELDEDEAVFELEVGAATAMVFDDPAVITFDAPSSSRPRLDDGFDDAFAELLEEPVEPAVSQHLAQQLAQHADAGDAAPAENENETIAEIFAALRAVDPFNVRDVRTTAAPRRKAGAAHKTELWTQLPFGSNRSWPRLEGVAAEFVDAAEQAAAAADRARPAPQKADAPKSDRPEWSALIASLRQDIERLRGEHQAPAAPTPAPAAARVAAAPRAATPPPARPVTDPNARKLKPHGGKPAQDEWGFFDPEQCGFAALLAKLNEITETGEENDARIH